jgi:hypothetical protein
MMTKVYPTPPRPVETHDGDDGGPSMRFIRQIARLVRKAVRRLPPLEPWEEELRFMAARASGPPAGPGRSWRREDLHDRT